MKETELVRSFEMFQQQKSLQIQQDPFPQEKSKVGTTINDWAHVLKESKYELANRLDEDRLIGLRELERLHLPHYKQETLPLLLFLQNPQKYFDKVGSQKFYINLPTRKKGLTRYRQINLSQNDVVKFIQEHVPASQSSDYTLVLSEFYENHYSGNIIINPDGEVLIEMVKGSHAPLASGEKTPEFFIWRNKFTHTFSYSFEDETLRKAIWNMLLVILHKGGEYAYITDINRSSKFTPGYYEFTLIKRKHTGTLEPIFIDYRSNSVYQL